MFENQSYLPARLTCQESILMCCDSTALLSDCQKKASKGFKIMMFKDGGAIDGAIDGAFILYIASCSSLSKPVSDDLKVNQATPWRKTVFYHHIHKRDNSMLQIQNLNTCSTACWPNTCEPINCTQTNMRAMFSVSESNILGPASRHPTQLSASANCVLQMPPKHKRKSRDTFCGKRFAPTSRAVLTLCIPTIQPGIWRWMTTAACLVGSGPKWMTTAECLVGSGRYTLQRNSGGNNKFSVDMHVHAYHSLYTFLKHVP